MDTYDFCGLLAGSLVALVVILLVFRDDPPPPPPPPPPRPKPPPPPVELVETMNLEADEAVLDEPPSAMPVLDADDDVDVGAAVGGATQAELAMLAEKRPESDRDIDFEVDPVKLFELERERAPKVYRDESRRS